MFEEKEEEKKEDEVKEINHSQEQFPSHVHFPFSASHILFLSGYIFLP